MRADNLGELRNENFNEEIGKPNLVFSSVIYSSVKYLIELFLVICSSPITLVLIVLFSILICIESKGNAIYSQERLGKNGRRFKIYKLRSMFNNAEENGPQWAMSNDVRITKVGKFIRKTRIDELPQLLNIIKGDMSLIGPRPERPEFVNEFEKEIPNFRDRLAVKPGLTGWAQINGGYDLTPAQKLEYDLYYIKKQSFIMDLVVLFRTVQIVFTGQGAR